MAPKCKEHPRYNILSLRASDEEMAEIMEAAAGRSTLSEFLLEAAIAYARRENEAAYRGRVKKLAA